MCLAICLLLGSCGEKHQPEDIPQIVVEGWIESDGYPVVNGPRITGDGYYESTILAIEGNLIEITV